MPTSPRGLARGQRFSSAATPKPSGGIRSYLAVRLGLPTPVVALACICSVGSLRCHLCKRSSFLNTAFASLHTASLEKGDSPRGGEMPAGQRGPLSTRGTAVRRWRDSFPATAANRFHKELRFFLFFTEKKKRSKKRKEFAFHLYYKVKYHTKITRHKNPPAGRTGGCCRRNITLFTLEIGA